MLKQPPKLLGQYDGFSSNLDQASGHPELVSGSKKLTTMKEAFVYIMSNKKRTTLYIGVTNDLERRVLEHKSGEGSLFTSKYKLIDLVYFEQIPGMTNAIEREKQLKNWHKDWKWNLVKESNPELIDLANEWFDD